MMPFCAFRLNNIENRIQNIIVDKQILVHGVIKSKCISNFYCFIKTVTLWLYLFFLSLILFHFNHSSSSNKKDLFLLSSEMMETNKPFFLIGEITARKYINGNNGMAISTCQTGLKIIQSIKNFQIRIIYAFNIKVSIVWRQNVDKCFQQFPSYCLARWITSFTTLHQNSGAQFERIYSLCQFIDKYGKAVKEDFELKITEPQSKENQKFLTFFITYF